ncbi:MAG: hypothetical protein SFU83_06365 [Meiothermus sp.]|nr:hypothetical protein [Meiothermus sp.]
MKLTLDTPLRLRLTDWGRDRHAARHRAAKLPTPNLYADDQGRVTMTLREFAWVFGVEMMAAGPKVVEGELEALGRADG